MNRNDEALNGGGTGLDRHGLSPILVSCRCRSRARERHLIGVDFLGTRIVLYRDAAGKPVVKCAWCPLAEIVEGRLRCPNHHWRLDAAGTCVHIPMGDKIPPGPKWSPTRRPRPGGLSGFKGKKLLFDVPRTHCRVSRARLARAIGDGLRRYH
jgi:hypothetical protein